MAVFVDIYIFEQCKQIALPITQIFLCIVFFPSYKA